jgi:hypothetical protein
MISINEDEDVQEINNNKKRVILVQKSRNKSDSE